MKPTLPATRRGSPDTRAAALFQRFSLRYGKHWLEMWVGVPLDAVMAEWDDTLARFHAVQIRQAIDACGKFPPTLPEFAALCEQMPRPFVAAAESRPQAIESKPVPMPDHIREELSRFLRKSRIAR